MTSTFALAALVLLFVAAGLIVRAAMATYFPRRGATYLAFRIPMLIPVAAYVLAAGAIFAHEWETVSWLLTPVRSPGTLIVRELFGADREIGRNAFGLLTWVLAGAFWSTAGLAAWALWPAPPRTPWESFAGTRTFSIHAPAPLRRYQDAVRELLNAEQIVSRVQPSIEVAAKIRAVVPPGTPVAAAHSAWLPKAVGDAETLPGFPRHDADVTCPPGILLVEVDCIGRRSGGMSSQFGYEGYFLSMLVLIDERKVWDARGAAAS